MADIVGMIVGTLVGVTVGAVVGAMVGAFVGATVGMADGAIVGGMLVGTAVGIRVGVGGTEQPTANKSTATTTSFIMCKRIRCINFASRAMRCNVANSKAGATRRILFLFWR